MKIPSFIRREGKLLTKTKWFVLVVFLMCITLLIALLGLLLGVQQVRVSEVFIPGTLDNTIVFGIRMPRVALGIMVGGALAGAGAALQAILRNPLADPFVLGVSGGAALGATFAIVGSVLFFGSGIMFTGGDISVTSTTIASSTPKWFHAAPVSLFASLGALGATFLMLSVSRTGNRPDPHAILLAGVVFNAFAAALILFLRTLVTPEQAHALLPWLAGHLDHRPWPHIAAGAIIIIPGWLFLAIRAFRLNLISTGEESAQSLGVNVNRTYLEMVIVISLMIGASVSLAGMIGFVGLIVPHILRLVLGPDHRLLIPASILGGASFLVASDLVSRLLFLSVGTEVPVGVVTAMLGAPVFLILLKNSSSKRYQ